MSHVDDLEELIVDTGERTFDALNQYSKDPSGTTNVLLWGILKALGIIGKILVDKSSDVPN